jgi:PAS domain S-box-containing protein
MRERLEEQGAELAAQNEALQQQTVELEMQTEQMQEQATELEMQNEQLQEQATELEVQAQQLEEQSVEMELSNHELSIANASLRQIEERLTLALESGGLGWWEWELPSQRIVWSPQVEAMHGMPAGTFDGTVATYLSLVHPDDHERVRRVLARSLAGVDDQYHVSHRFFHRDGSVRWLEANARLRHDERGTPTSLLGIVTDVTERVELLASEQSARQAAEAANLAKATFLATMSHELRTPLNAITGYADLLALGIRGPVNAAQLDDITRIKKSSQHLLSLINDILNFARLEAGRVEFHVSDVPVRELLADVDALVTPQMAGKELRYGTEACSEQLAVRGDREKIQQVLLNLMTNAIKFTDEGGITIACESDGTTVRIRVRDTGRGIAPEKLGSIFQPFVQIDRQLTSESQQGVGLGLAISRDLARGMGGDLTVESTLGRGSTFTLVLPRA